MLSTCSRACVHPRHHGRDSKPKRSEQVGDDLFESPPRRATLIVIGSNVGNEKQLLVTSMNRLSRFIAIAVVPLLLVSPVIAQASPRSHPLGEDAALALLDRTLKHDRVYANRISLDCVSYGTEETTNAYFEFVLREIHNAKCGGDPETSHVLDRYRVYRRSGKIERYQPIDDSWHRYDPAKIK